MNWQVCGSLSTLRHILRTHPARGRFGNRSFALDSLYCVVNMQKKSTKSCRSRELTRLRMRKKKSSAESLSLVGRAYRSPRISSRSIRASRGGVADSKVKGRGPHRKHRSLKECARQKKGSSELLLFKNKSLQVFPVGLDQTHYTKPPS